MSRTDTWMPLYIADYLGDTMHLNTAQHGAYLLMLMHHWRNGPLPDDDAQLAAICRLDTATWKKSFAPVLLRFFDETPGGLVQKRLMAEREFACELTDKRAVAGKAGAAKRWARSGKKTETGNGGGNGNGSGDEYANGHSEPIANAMANAMANPTQGHSQPNTPSPSSLRSETNTPGSLRSPPPKPTMPDIPPWMPMDAWNGFVAMRKASRKPFTPHAAELVVAKLGRFRDRGLDVAEALNQSTEAGWTGVFEPKSAIRQGAKPQDGWAQIDRHFDNLRADAKESPDDPFATLHIGGHA